MISPQKKTVIPTRDPFRPEVTMKDRLHEGTNAVSNYAKTEFDKITVKVRQSVKTYPGAALLVSLAVGACVGWWVKRK